MYIGVEIGATKLQVILAKADGSIHGVLHHAVEIARGAQGILAWIVQAIHELQGLSPEPLQGIGIGFGGVVSRASGSTLLSVQVSGWDHFPLRDFFEKTFSLPCVVENDTVCGGYAEYKMGSGKGIQGFFYTNIGSGIGGALFSQGRLLKGQDLGCAYFGHTWVPSWEEAGKPEKIENLCSGFSIERRLNHEGYVPAASALRQIAEGGRFSCKQLGQAAAAGDAFALEEIDRVAKSFGIGLGNVLTLFHPERISIGGSVSHLGELLLAPLRRYAKTFAFEPCKNGFEIVKCIYTEEAVPLGAAILVANRKEYEPE
ncbi:MAG: ROK family protein [Eubacteriales bacterium]|nr:ROK family protein [Eubacteriales bacterium]